MDNWFFTSKEDRLEFISIKDPAVDQSKVTAEIIKARAENLFLDLPMLDDKAPVVFLLQPLGAAAYHKLFAAESVDGEEYAWRKRNISLICVAVKNGVAESPMTEDIIDSMVIEIFLELFSACVQTYTVSDDVEKN